MRTLSTASGVLQECSFKVAKNPSQVHRISNASPMNSGCRQAFYFVMLSSSAISSWVSNEEWFKTWLADLQQVNPEFRTWWSQHDVRKIADTRNEIHHPLVGRLLFEHTTLQVPSVPDLKVMIYTPLLETDTLAKLQQVMAQTEAASVPVVE